MLKRLLLAFTLLLGAAAAVHSPSQATPLSSSAHAERAAPSQAEQAYVVYIRRRPRYRYYRYYRPRVRYYRPRYRVYRAYRPRYRYYRRW